MFSILPFSRGRWPRVMPILLTACLLFCETAQAQFANVQQVPHKILLSGTDLNDSALSPNARQLAEQIGIIPVLSQLKDVQNQLNTAGKGSPDSVSLRLSLLELREEASEIIEKTRLEIAFVQAEITDEQNLYSELLASYTAKRDRKIAITNAIGFGLNGSLWAIAEAYTIPTWRTPRLSIPSGTIGILAGIIPSITSAYTLKEVTGNRYSAPAEPNMLARVLDRPADITNQYPQSVWDFLESIPAGEAEGIEEADKAKSRKEQIVDRWIADKNLPHFTGKESKEELDLVTASTPQKKKVTIDLLNERKAMLEQLSGEIGKMSRLLLEIMMVVRGEKEI
jgi:hypothetical protein